MNAKTESVTPRTDAVAREHVFISDNGNKVAKAQNVDADFARALERENADLRERYASALADSLVKSRMYNEAVELLSDLREQLAAERRRVVEECAKVAEQAMSGEQDDITRQACDGIARRIRAISEPQQAAKEPSHD